MGLPSWWRKLGKAELQEVEEEFVKRCAWPPRGPWQPGASTSCCRAGNGAGETRRHRRYTLVPTFFATETKTQTIMNPTSTTRIALSQPNVAK